jgi:hypothetical protein
MGPNFEIVYMVYDNKLSDPPIIPINQSIYSQTRAHKGRDQFRPNSGRWTYINIYLIFV